MKKYLTWLLLFVALIFTTPADAANRFWVGGGGDTNWSTAGNWSASTGGAGGSALNTGDAAIFDASSGTGTSTVTAFSIVTLDMSASSAVTLAGVGALTITGNTFKLGAAITVTYVGSVTFTSTSGTTAITSAGKTLNGIIMNGVGGTFQLADALLSVSQLLLTNGTFDANNFAVTLATLSSSNANVRTLTMGSGLWTLTSGITPWDTTTTTNLTFNKNTANITWALGAALTNPASQKTTGFQPGGLTFNDLTITNPSGFYSAQNIGGAGTFAHLNVTAPVWVGIGNAVTVTVSNPFTWSGTNLTTGWVVVSTTSGGAAGGAQQGTISVASGSPAISNSIIYGIAFTGGATFAATNSIDHGNNSGITITAPGGGGTVGHIIGGGLAMPENCIELFAPSLKPGANDNVCIQAQAA